jgi:hypothetical protein
MSLGFGAAGEADAFLEGSMCSCLSFGFAGDRAAVQVLKADNGWGLSHIGNGCPDFGSRCLLSGLESSDAGSLG